MDALGVFRQFAAIGDPEKARDFLLQQPALLSPAHWPAIDAWVAATGSSEREGALRAQRLVRAMYQYMSEDLSRYPLGAGPIERIARRVLAGEISLETGLESASAPAFRALLSPVYVRALIGYAHAAALSGGWREALPLARLVLATLDERAHDELDEVWPFVVLPWLEIVVVATLDVPDGRLFHPAVRLGERLVDEARNASDDRLAGEALHRLGVLHLDPYLSGRSLTNFGPVYRIWRSRLASEYGEELVGEPDETMPELDEAMERAEDYLRRALDFRSGVERARTLKALGEVLANGAVVLEREPDGDEIVALVTEAYELYEMAGRRDQLVVLSEMLARFDASPPGSHDSNWLLGEPMEEIVARSGPRSTIDIFAQEAGRLLRAKDPRAVDVWRRVGSVVEAHGTADDRIAYYTNGLTTLGGLIDQLLPGIDTRQPIDSLTSTTLKASAERGWGQSELGERLLAIAAKSTSNDREAQGLAVLDTLVSECPVFVAAHRELVLFTRASLLVGEGANLFHADEPADSAHAYLLALGDFLEVDLIDPALQMVDRVASMVDGADEDTLTHIVVGLSVHIVALESKAGPSAVRANRALCQKLMAELARNSRLNAQLLFVLWQVSKGARFSAAVTSRMRLEADGAAGFGSVDELGRELLRRIDEVTRELKESNVDPWVATPAAALDEDDFLGSYAGEARAGSGNTLEDALENLEHRFDANLDRRLVADRLEIRSLDEYQETLDERTALLAYLLGATADGMAAVYILLLTRDSIDVRIGVDTLFPAAVISMTAEGVTTRMHHLALSVGASRKAIQRDPLGDDPVDVEASGLLDSAWGRYLGGGIADRLDELRSEGKDHLVIVPHGALHYFPFHLMRKDGRTLAEDWIITYLPNLELAHRIDPGASTRERFRAFGNDFAEFDPHGAGELPNAEQEATELADLLGGRARVGRDATESALREALEHARMVHVATHGELRVRAPAFQRLYVMPGDDSDGIVNAYELLDLDLRGLDLVTLSACETGLGRFDEGDNMRGLPATLLLAGASTLIVTLWPVETYAASHFFHALYHHIGAGSGKLDAFAAAQSETREAYPQYRDWGAFRLLGAWS